MKVMCILLVILALVLCSEAQHDIIPCVVVKSIANSILEKWFFDQWDRTIFKFASASVTPLIGEWSFELTFCETVRIYMGNMFNNASLLGWSYGVLSNFVVTDAWSYALATKGSKKLEAPIKSFIQTFSWGDSGAPCPNGRSSIVAIFCGENNTCADVPNSSGAFCLSGSLNEGFCLCSVGFNSTQGLCNGLWLNLLSNTCPPSNQTAIPPKIPVSPMNDPSAPIIATLVVIFALAYVGGYIYNYSVHSKRGLEALPFYDTCTGTSRSPTYSGYSH